MLSPTAESLLVLSREISPPNRDPAHSCLAGEGGSNPGPRHGPSRAGDLSGRKEVKCGSFKKNVISSPSQFDTANCVVARQSFSSGRHYWEVFVGQKPRWSLGIVSERAERRGRLIQKTSGSCEVCAEGYWLIGYNKEKTGKPYWAFDTNPMPFDCSSHPETIGVYLDYTGGEVTFYNPDNLIPLYSFYNAAFKDAPVYPFFDPCWHDNGGNAQPLKIL
ncbi:unnamed protein product [Caretta caretta]